MNTAIELTKELIQIKMFKAELEFLRILRKLWLMAIFSVILSLTIVGSLGVLVYELAHQISSSRIMIIFGSISLISSLLLAYLCQQRRFLELSQHQMKHKGLFESQGYRIL